MGKNKIRDLLHVFVPSPKRSTFDRSHTNPITADIGYIYPVLVDELLPSDYVKLDLMSFVQTNPLTKPLLGRFTLKFEAFFVPLRLYCQNLDLNNVNPDFSNDFDLPYFGLYLDSSVVRPENEFLTMKGTNLLCYLNMIPSGCSTKTGFGGLSQLNGVPFVGYMDIYRNYYANPQDNLVPFRVGRRKVPTQLDHFDVQDHYVTLAQFDKFVTTLARNSVDDSGEASAMDVFTVFQKAFRNPVATNNEFTSAPPLFNGQIWNGSNNEFVADVVTENALHLGLLRRTYNDDYFTAFFSPISKAHLRTAIFTCSYVNPPCR